MADIDEKPQTWMEATRALRKAMAEGTSENILGGDPNKARSGGSDGDSGNDPMDYMGHFREREVMDEGHNTGAPGKVRKFHDSSSAKQGYRVIPGNAASGYTERKVRAAVDAMDSKMGGTVPRGPIAAPVGHPLRHRDLMARKATGPGVGPIKSAKMDPKKPSGMGLPSKRR